MFTNKVASLVIVFLLICVIVGLVIHYSVVAQEERPKFERPRFGDPAGAAMCTFGDYIFILKGMTLYKIDPEKMEVAKKLTIEEEKKLPQKDLPKRPGEEEND